MKTTSIRARALGGALQSGTLKGTLCALLAGTALCGLAADPAAAQSSPTFRNLDSNGVDLVKGDFLTSFPEGSIGSGEAELALLRMIGATGSNGTTGSSQWDHILFNIVSSGTYVDFGSRNDKFPGAESRGSSLAGSGDFYQYRSPDGTVIAFGNPTSGNDANYCDGTAKPSCILLPGSITSPDGKVVNINYEFWTVCYTTGGGGGGGGPPREPGEGDPPPVTECSNTPRIASVTNSYGYEVRFTYASPAGSGSSGPPADFHQRTGASFYNVNASSSPLAGVSYSPVAPGVTDVTDMGGRVWRVTSASAGYAIRRPGATADTTSATLSNGIVTSVTNEGVTTNYSRSVSGGTATMTVTNALSQATTVVSDLTTGRPTSVTDPLSHTTSFTYEGSGLLKRTTAHEGNYVEHTYDARGNITQTVAVPKGGSGPTIVTSAVYAQTCSNPKTCNRPDSTTDARGNVTVYEYDPDHGGVTAVTAPAPTPGAPQPQTRYDYALTNGEYRLTDISQCQTAGACAGTADEVKTTIAYDANGNVTSTSSGNGIGTLTATSAMTYDWRGNLETVDGPLPGPEDTSRIRYNKARQVVGIISPDPDGPGSATLRHRAVRNTYGASTGLLDKVEQGSVASQSKDDWAAFSPAHAVETTYEHSRPVVSKLVSGSTVHALSQTGYDSLGRPVCSVQRMNPAEFGSPPPACNLGGQGTGSGNYGPDRITRTFYDLAGRVTQVRTAMGIPGQEADEFSRTFTPNGQVETLVDGEDNKTTYVYDGHDRLERTYFPLTARGAGASNASVYEQLTYESLAGGARTSGLVAAFRNRASETIGFGHDSLGRQTSKDLPGSEPDAAYAFDLLGRLKSATQNGITVAFTYDALGRQLTQTIPIAMIAFPTFTSEYDLAGRRTRLTWPVDASSPTAYHADYDYLVTGEVARIQEKGATSGAGVLAAYGYDDLGRRTGLIRGNGTSTSYRYDPASRLDQIVHSFPDPAHDLTLTHAFNHASQIVSTLRSNDLYAWTGHGSGTTGSTANGLNQLDDHGGTNVTHDARGNITFDGVNSYAYSSENLLTSYTNAGLLEYDPLMRFYRNGPTYFIRDGTGSGQLLGEYFNGSIAVRYVPGPGMDEPVASVSKTGTRHWYHADERGSIVARSDDDAAASRIFRYDEYGNRQGPVGGARFGYTGQVHILGGIYDYKNRNYNPRLGRFLQTDPIGYGDGMNMYAYVGGDPVNFVDPSGLRWVEACVGEEGNMKCGLQWVDDGSGGSGGAARFRGSSRGAASSPPEGGGDPGPDGIQCPPSGNRSFLTPEDAGLAAVQAQRQAQARAGDQRERSFALRNSAGGGYGYQLRREPGTRFDVPITYSAVGGGHTHTVGGGNTLSRRSDTSDPRNRGDVENIRSGLRDLEKAGVDVRNVTTILGAENGTVFAWKGRNVATEGKPIGPDKCE